MIPLYIIVCNLYFLDETKASKERQVKFAKFLVKLDQKINNAPAALDNDLLPMTDSDEEMRDLEDSLDEEDRQKQIVSYTTVSSKFQKKKFSEIITIASLLLDLRTCIVIISFLQSIFIFIFYF